MTDPRERFRVFAKSTSGRGYQFHNKATAGTRSSVRVDLYDEIGGYWGVSARDFVKELMAQEVDEIDLHINSPGGDVFDGIAILNALRQHKASVTVTVDGLAASSASFIAMAGDTVRIARNAEIMIHEPWTLAMGDATDMRDVADRLDRVGSNIADIYVSKAGGSVDEWRERMVAETWYSHEEAVAVGLADEVLDADPNTAEKAKNEFDLSIFASTGRSKAPAPYSPAPMSASGSTPKHTEREEPAMSFTDEQVATLRERLGVADSAADGAVILAALDEALAERAEPAPKNSPLPEGTVMVDRAQLDELKAAAQAGVQARQQQEQEARERIVDAAIDSGRIAPARREAWLNRLAADAGEADTLNALEPGLIPVNGPRGSTGGTENTSERTDADALYESVYGKDA